MDNGLVSSQQLVYDSAGQQESPFHGAGSRFAQRSQQREQLELLFFLAFSLASCYTLARILLANELLVNSAPSP